MRFRRDDGAVTEVIGFVLSFAISAIFLLISLNAFWTARANTDAVVSAVELKTIADRVAGRIVEASLVSQEFPNATMTLTLNIPQSVNGHPYYVTAYTDRIVVTAHDGTASATATTFKLDAVDNVQVSGVVQSSNERLVVQYRLIRDWPTPGINTHDIQIQEAT